MSNLLFFCIMENSVKKAVKKLIDLTPVRKHCYELSKEQRVLLADKTWIIGLDNESNKKISAELKRLHPFKTYQIDAKQMDETELAKAIKSAKLIFSNNEEQSVVISPNGVCLPSADKEVLFLSDDFCQDILENHVKGNISNLTSATTGNVLNHWVMKNYQQIWIYGDTLMSGVYAAYAASEIKKYYGKYPLILLFHDNDVRSMPNVDINNELLKTLGIPVFCKITENDIYEIPAHALFITPQHRLLYTQRVIEDNNVDIYTIPETDVIIKDGNLAMYYIDRAMDELPPKQNGSTLCQRLWRQAKLAHNFAGQLHHEVKSELSEAMELLLKEHKPRLQKLYGQI